MLIKCFCLLFFFQYDKRVLLTYFTLLHELYAREEDDPLNSSSFFFKKHIGWIFWLNNVYGNLYCLQPLGDAFSCSLCVFNCSSSDGDPFLHQHYPNFLMLLGRTMRAEMRTFYSFYICSMVSMSEQRGGQSRHALSSLNVVLEHTNCVWARVIKMRPD